MEEAIVYSVTDAAELLSVHRRTLLKAISAGRLKAARLGTNDFRVSKAELARFWSEAGGGELFTGQSGKSGITMNVRAEGLEYIGHLEPDGVQVLEEDQLFYYRPTKEVIVNRDDYWLIIPVGDSNDSEFSVGS